MGQLGLCSINQPTVSFFFSGLSLRAGAWGFSLATVSMTPPIFVGNKRKMGPKELPGCSVSHLLNAYTWLLEILATALVIVQALGIIVAFFVTKLETSYSLGMLCTSHKLNVFEILGAYLSGIIITLFVYQKGTGKWTAISALEYGMPVTLIGEFMF